MFQLQENTHYLVCLVTLCDLPGQLLYEFLEETVLC